MNGVADIPDTGDTSDTGLTDAGLTDAGLTDAGLTDADLTDAGATSTAVVSSDAVPVNEGATGEPSHAGNVRPATTLKTPTWTLPWGRGWRGDAVLCVPCASGMEGEDPRVWVVDRHGKWVHRIAWPVVGRSYVRPSGSGSPLYTPKGPRARLPIHTTVHQAAGTHRWCVTGSRQGELVWWQSVDRSTGAVAARVWTHSDRVAVQALSLYCCPRTGITWCAAALADQSVYVWRDPQHDGGVEPCFTWYPWHDAAVDRTHIPVAPAGTNAGHWAQWEVPTTVAWWPTPEWENVNARDAGELPQVLVVGGNWGTLHFITPDTETMTVITPRDAPSQEQLNDPSPTSGGALPIIRFAHLTAVDTLVHIASPERAGRSELLSVDAVGGIRLWQWRPCPDTRFRLWTHRVCSAPGYAQRWRNLHADPVTGHVVGWEEWGSTVFVRQLSLQAPAGDKDAAPIMEVTTLFTCPGPIDGLTTFAQYAVRALRALQTPEIEAWPVNTVLVWTSEGLCEYPLRP